MPKKQNKPKSKTKPQAKAKTKTQAGPSKAEIDNVILWRNFAERNLDTAIQTYRKVYNTRSPSVGEYAKNVVTFIMDGHDLEFLATRILLTAIERLARAK